MAYPGYGAPGGYGGAPPPGGYAPPQGGPYGAPPQGGPYGAPPQGGYGAPPSGAYGAPPAGGYSAPPQAGFGAPPHAGFGAPHPGGYQGQPQGGINPEIQQWFMSVDSDRSGRITANELQRALVNADWSQFNPETCRLMIGMFDKDCSGTIDIHEFQALWHYIKQWKATFDSYDSNRSGNVEAMELQRAFQSMGYNLSPQFVQTVVVKFDHLGRRSLTFDSFIQASVMLKSLTDAFKQRDSTMSGSVRMSYEDFMSLAVSFKP